MRWFLPRNDDFVALFEEASANIVKGVSMFRQILDAPGDLPAGVERLKEVEHEGDRITHQTLAKLNTSFITPFDREDIHTLITRLDDILDSTDAAGQRLVLYRIQEIPPRLIGLSDILVTSAREVQKAVLALHQASKHKEALAACVEINRLENDADALLREALADLFANSPDAIHVLKLKDLYSFLEDATDRCEDVANAVESIIIKAS